MATRTDCYPWWHATYEPLARAPQIAVPSGCSVNADGNIPCAPEAMRAKAEARMQALGLLDKLDLATYTLARYMHSEVGTGTIEERVAVGEAAVNRARLEKLPQGVVSLLLYRQPSRLYGEIQRGGTGRWAATSRDPTALTILLADLITSGRSGNFNDGADDQDGLEYIQYFPNPEYKIQYEAKRGQYWVGPRPGVDHWKTWQWRKYGVTPTSPMGAMLMQRARDEIARCKGELRPGLRCANRPVWPADLPICSGGGGGGGPSGGEIVLAVAGLAAGVFAGRFAARRLGFMV